MLLLKQTTAGGQVPFKRLAGPWRPSPAAPDGRGLTLPLPTGECYAFASFRLYPKQRTLARGNEHVAIGGRAFDLLLLLVVQAGNIVSLNDIMSFVWPNVTVDEANLRVQMGLVRKALSRCDKAQHAIETVWSRGYCFILDVRHHPDGTDPTVPEHLRLNTLPPLANPPHGREGSIDVIRTALDIQQLVTITGPGGIGKTTVAIEAAKAYASSRATRVIFVDLSDVTGEFGIIATIASALGLGEQGDPLTALCEDLRLSSSLLILDTCEHIAEPVSRLVEILLIRCINLKLLVTSREALHTSREWIHRLPALTFPEANEPIDEGNLQEFSALKLFVDRVRSSMPFELQSQELAVLAEICRRLDGIPLALELAVARISDLGILGIATHLDDCLSILTRGRRTAPLRHRALAASFDWSYGLLSADEQFLLQYLATIDGPFTTEHAIAGARRAGCSQPLTTLGSLYEKSLLSIDTNSETLQYCLFNTTRAYVLSKNGA